jgi:hypothetical protein
MDYTTNPKLDFFRFPPSPYCSFHRRSSFMLDASNATEAPTCVIACLKSSNLKARINDAEKPRFKWLDFTLAEPSSLAWQKIKKSEHSNKHWTILP